MYCLWNLTSDQYLLVDCCTQEDEFSASLPSVEGKIINLFSVVTLINI